MNALGNISAHYDLGNDMFKAFLDETLTYSCPIWASEDEALETAQLRKIHAILDRANVQPGQHILEIGTGWGTLAIEAATKYKCTVTSITLSREQQILAQERIKKLGLENKIEVLLQDYRAMDPNEKFDHIVSVEMLEAVGPEFLSTFFKCCDQLLKPNGNLSVQVSFNST
jgi:cyclopropane-fatty-acyl-phospholipid synthase